ncbi:MAG: sensor domain-containing diguanylate cyclase [Candidatus Edwardsbacteria bacterium]
MPHSNPGIDKRIATLKALQEIGLLLSSIHNLDELLQNIVKVTYERLHYYNCTILMRKARNNELVVRAFQGYKPEVIKRFHFVVGGEGIIGWVAKYGKPLLIPDVRKEPRYKEGWKEVKSELAVPLRIRNKIVGVLNVESDKVNAFDQNDLDALTTVAHQASIAIENILLYERLKFSANTDPLTKLFNRRYFQEHLQEEEKRANRYEHPFSLVMIDVDWFKNYNDSCGHSKGDYVLREIAKIMKHMTRHSDIVTRYGGEEFVILLPETDKRGGIVVAEKIRRAVESQQFPKENCQPLKKLTISLGVATYPKDGREIKQLIDKADQALYQAKQEGKNRVCFA